MRDVTVEPHLAKADTQHEAGLTITTRRRWIRLFACYGEPPGSHIGIWRTRAGTVHGWNLRLGRRYEGPCLTLLAHTRTLP